MANVVFALSSARKWLQHGAPALAVYAGGAVHLLLVVIAIDGMFNYQLQLSRISPTLRGIAFLFIIGLLIREMAAIRRILIDPVVGTLTVYLLLGAAVGLLEHGLTYVYARHLFAAATMLGSYWLGIYFVDRISYFFGPVERVAWATGATCLIFLAIGLPAGYIGQPNTNLSASIPILLTFSYAVIARKPWIAVCCLLFILLTNLRGGILGMSIILSVFWTERLFPRQGIILKMLASGVGALLIFVSAIVLIAVTDRFVIGDAFTVGERSARTIAVISEVIRGESGIETETTRSRDKAEHPLARARTPDQLSDVAFSGRLGQAADVWASLGSQFLIGRGFGSEYVWSYWSEYLRSQQVSYMHQTDFAVSYFLLTGGLLFSALLALSIGWQKYQLFRRIDGKHFEPFFVLGFGVTMFFAFQPNTPLFWLLFGAFSHRPLVQARET